MERITFNFFILFFCSIFYTSCLGNDGVDRTNKRDLNIEQVEKGNNIDLNLKENIELINANSVNLKGFKIVVSSHPSKVEVNAANQLLKHLNKYGLTNIVNEKDNFSGSRIFIGNTLAFKNKFGSIGKYVGRDGIIIKFDGNDIYIHGERQRAILYATYEFLEQFIGIRFWTPTEVSYPNEEDVSIIKKDYAYTPPFYYRGGYSNNANTNIEFAAILKENGDFQLTNENWGDVNKILGWVHTFNTILPYSKYGVEHPEWYLDPSTNQPMTKFNPRLDGMLTQPYFYNEEMKQQFIKNTFAWIEENPQYEIISISSNDNTLFTKPKNSKYNSSDLLLGFLNDIANEVVKKYPGKKIETLAYHATEIPPLQVKSAANLIVRIAPITSNMGYSYRSPINLNPYKRFRGWMNIDSEKFYWGYDTNFRYPMLPYPSFGRLGDDLALMKENKFTGIFIQDNLNPYGYFQDMKTWVLAKLLWNPSLDQEKLIKEFFDGYYRESSDPLYQYYKLVEKTFVSSSRVLVAYQEDYKFLNNKNFLSQAANLFANAVSISKSKKILEKVNNEKLSFDALNAYLGNLSYSESSILMKKIDSKIVNRHERNNFKNFSKIISSKISNN